MTALRTILFLAACCVSFAQPYYPPSSRTVEWEPGVNVGVVGGFQQYITARTTLIDVTQSPYNADNTGATDARAAIQSAWDAATSGQVVYLPAGTYRMNSYLDLGTKDNVTIRGASEATTTLKANFTGSYMIYQGSSSSYQWISDMDLSASASKGDTVLTFSSTAAISGKPNGGVGCLARVSVKNLDDNADITAGAALVVSTQGYPYEQCQIVKITAVTGTTVTIEEPLAFDMPIGRVPQISVATLWSEKVGIENLTLDLDDGVLAGNTSFGVQMSQTMECWLYRVNVYRPTSYHINIAYSYRPEFFQCRFRYIKTQADQGSAGKSGIVYGMTGNGLIENNIITDNFPLVEVNSGCTGNAFLYNFAVQSFAYSGPGHGFITNHGPHNTCNLYEGNIASSFKSDGYFGSESNGTLYRNWIMGRHKEGTTDFRGYTVGLNRFTRNYSVVGNIQGKTGVTAFLNQFGYPNIGNEDYTGTAAPTSSDFWADWKATGTLTTRTSDTAGVFTMDSASYGYVSGNTITVWWTSRTKHAVDASTTVSGTSLTMASVAFGPSVNPATALPAEGTVVEIFGGSNGFQELDLDVEPSTILKANYNTNDAAIPAGQALGGGETLPNSYAYASQPSWWPAGIAWPPFDPLSPNMDYEALPAGYAYVNGDWPSSATGNATVTGTTTVSGTLTLP